MTRKSSLKSGKMKSKDNRFAIQNTKQVVLSFTGQNSAQTAILPSSSAASDVTLELEDTEVSSSTCRVTSPLMAAKKSSTSSGRGPLDRFLVPVSDVIAIKRRRQEADSTCAEASALSETRFIDLTNDKENNEPNVEDMDEDDVDEPEAEEEESGSSSEAEETSIDVSKKECESPSASVSLTRLELSEKRNREAAERRARKDAERAFSRAERERQQRAREAAKQALREEREIARREREAERLAKKSAEESEKEAKRVQKEAEKQKKEEERLKREEEKAKARREKEEELRKEEERKQILSQKQSNFFCGFFVKKSGGSDASAVSLTTFVDKSGVSTEEEQQDGRIAEMNRSVEDEAPRFAPFCLKKDMRLAPLTRVNLSGMVRRLSVLDELLTESNCLTASKLYLEELRQGIRQACSDVSTWRLERSPSGEELDDSSVVEMTLDTAPQWLHVIYLHFHEDHRPPYYGTVGNRRECREERRRFATRLARCPSRPLVGSLDYDVESAEEWEEEEPGEDVQFSGDEDDEAAALAVVEEEEMESDGFFVPHGYLSEDEVSDLSNCEADADAAPSDFEMRKAKQVLSEREFTDHLRRRITPLRPQFVLWPAANVLCEFNAFLFPAAVSLPLSVLDDDVAVLEEQTPGQTDDGSSKKRKGFPEDVLPHLLRFVHGNSLGLDRLIFEFRAWYQGRLGLPTGSLNFAATTNLADSVDRVAFLLSKRQLRKKIREVAPQHENGRWAVKPELLALNGLTVTPASAGPALWDYVTDANQFRRASLADSNTSGHVTSTTPNRPSSNASETPVRSIVKYFQQQSDNPSKSSVPLLETDASSSLNL